MIAAIMLLAVHAALAQDVPAPAATSAPAAPPALIPRPARIETAAGEFRLIESSRIIVDPDTPETRAVADYLAAHLRAVTGIAMQVPVGNSEARGGSIYLHARPAFRAVGQEGYELHVSPESCTLKAWTPRGLFLGAQTLRQLLSPDAKAAVPCVHITDRPRYRHRGLLLDCGRHFMPKQFVKRYIDLLAFHKMNVLHWHLTEDQGWRIEIKKYPKLTEVGAWRQATRDSEQPRVAEGRYGGFYTQSDVREIVAFAKSRYVTIIPEIEMPGHSMAALAGYPELSCAGGPFEVSTRWGVHDDVYCAGNDQTFEFLQNVLAEVIDLFPSEYVHIGGDECPKTRWKACAKCQARIKAEGLRDEHELQSYFIRRIEQFLNSRGRRLIGWDEILEGGVAPKATVQSWRGMAGAVSAATAGHDVISSPTTHCYLDYAQGLNPAEPAFMGFVSLEQTYSFEPTPPELSPPQIAHVLGAEGNMWTEHAPPTLVDRQVFPRLCALAEVTWSPKDTRSWDDFSARMKTHYRRLDALGVGYYVPPPLFRSAGAALIDPTFTDTLELALENAFHDGRLHVTLDGSDPTPASPKYEKPLRLTDTTVVKARTILTGGHAGVVGEVGFRKLRPIEAVTSPDAQPGFQFAYYEGEWSKLPDFDALTPSAVGPAKALDTSLRKREEWYGLSFKGFIDVAADGIYTFYVRADDGARLRVGAADPCDIEVRWDGGEAVARAWLKPGRHPLRLDYLQKGGAQAVEVSYEGPGVSKRPVTQ